MNPNVKSKRHAMLGKLFISAQENGISSEDLRDYIAPELIGKRLSAASERELEALLAHIAGPMKKKRDGNKRYASSMQGLRDEVVDLAKQRWGGDWETPLNNLCKRFGVDHWRFLDLRHGKSIKNWLTTIQGQGAWGQGQGEPNHG